MATHDAEMLSMANATSLADELDAILAARAAPPLVAILALAALVGRVTFRASRLRGDLSVARDNFFDVAEFEVDRLRALRAKNTPDH